MEGKPSQVSASWTKAKRELGHVGPIDTVTLSTLASDFGSAVVVSGSVPLQWVRVFRVLLKYLFLGRVLKSGIACDYLRTVLSRGDSSRLL